MRMAKTVKRNGVRPLSKYHISSFMFLIDAKAPRVVDSSSWLANLVQIVFWYVIFTLRLLSHHSLLYCSSYGSNIGVSLVPINSILISLVFIVWALTSISF